MLIPEGKTEEEVLDAIERAVNILAPTFTFGFYDLDDIKQFGRLKAIELMNDNKYDPSLPLENFIYAHVRHRFLNLRRNLLMRSDPPCKKCHSGEPCVSGGCRAYEVWRRRNLAKANIMRPVEMDESHESTNKHIEPPSVIDRVAAMVKIDTHLPVELRIAWLQINDGVRVAKSKRELIQSTIEEILLKA